MIPRAKSSLDSHGKLLESSDFMKDSTQLDEKYLEDKEK